LALLAGLANAATVERASDAVVLQLDIPSQPVGDALSRLAEAARLQIVFYSEVAAGVMAPRLVGSYTIRDALDRLLAETPLEYEFLSEQTVSVRARATEPQRANSNTPISRTGHGSAAKAGSEVMISERPGADTRDPWRLEEIMVTARRRYENLQTTPVALTALSGEALELRMVHSAEALAQVVPNLQFDGAAPLSGAAYNATVFIRGVGQNDFAIFSDPGVAVYLDGVYLGRSIGGAMDLLDLAQIEVLRGPQGTLFGRNTIGGAIILRSRGPEASVVRELAVTVGSLDRREIRGVLNVPISETIATRITGASLRRDGYATRLTDQDQLGDKDSAIGRAQIAWRPSERTAGTLIVDATRVRQNSAALTLIDVASYGTPFLNLYNALVAPTLGVTSPDGGSSIDRSWVTSDIDTTNAGGNSVNELESLGAALTFEWQLDSADRKGVG
jgi:iron complex outermembrane receptor protein